MTWSTLASALSCTFFLTVAMISSLRKIYSCISIFLWLKVQKSWLLNCTQVCFKPHTRLSAADLSLLTFHQTDSMLQVMVIAMIVLLELLPWAVPVSYTYRLDSELSPPIKKFCQHQPVKNHASFANSLALLVELFIISLHWVNCWTIQSLVLQEVWKRQYGVFQKLHMKNWTKLRSVAYSGAYVAPDIGFLRSLWLPTCLL